MAGTLSIAMGAMLMVGTIAVPGVPTATGQWRAISNMRVARSGATATLLPDGWVLVAGGYGCAPTYVCASAELYDPRHGAWRITGPMTTGRAGHTATLLPDGQVLVAGGVGCSSALACASAELYDPATGRWAATGSMSTGRWAHTATLLRSGQVLVAGGYFCPPLRFCASAELYNPITGRWHLTGAMPTPRWAHTATLLRSGQVLVAGGEGCIPSYSCASAELYNPVTGRWYPTGSMSTGREEHTATLLPDGRVLVAGGYGCAPTYVCASAELYDPRHGAWRIIGPMTTGRAGHTATLLPDGQVLVAGGYGCERGRCGHLTSAEVYDPVGGTWRLADDMTSPREYQTATLLPDGRVLVAGGSARCAYTGCVTLASAALYAPNHKSPRSLHAVPRRIVLSPSTPSFRCATTPVHDTPLEGNGIPGTPWVQAEPVSAGITGHLFVGNRLLHTNGWMPDGTTTKTYWRLADGQGQIGLTITGRDLSSGRGSRSVTLSNGILIVPTPGCWQLDLTGERGQVKAHATFIILGD